MNRQQSFSNKKATLFLVATPIGNLEEMTIRAINTLKEVDIIAAEDTRNTAKILNYFNIKTKMISHHEHNIESSIPKILSYLNNNQNVALVSDAGYPAISDPGYDLVKECINSDYNIVSISGANACLNALVVSGIKPQPFLFYGFLNHSAKQKRKELSDLTNTKETLVFYESPHRIKKTLTLMLEYFGDRNIALCRELTKKFEEIIRGSISDVINTCDELKGEMVIIVSGNEDSTSNEIIFEVSIIDQVQYYIDRGMSTKDAAREVANQRGLKKNSVYNQYINKE